MTAKTEALCKLKKKKKKRGDDACFNLFRTEKCRILSVFCFPLLGIIDEVNAVFAKVSRENMTNHHTVCILTI